MQRTSIFLSTELRHTINDYCAAHSFTLTAGIRQLMRDGLQFAELQATRQLSMGFGKQQLMRNEQEAIIGVTECVLLLRQIATQCLPDTKHVKQAAKDALAVTREGWTYDDEQPTI